MPTSTKMRPSGECVHGLTPPCCSVCHVPAFAYKTPKATQDRKCPPLGLAKPCRHCGETGGMHKTDCRVWPTSTSAVTLDVPDKAPGVAQEPRSPPKVSQGAAQQKGEKPGWKTVLAAACQFSGAFGRTALIIAAWRQDNGLFGLDGIPLIHPDANKVWALMCGKRGLIGKGLIEKMAENQYQVTPKGRKEGAT